jgi:uncharacterized protein (DUF305 family)
MTARRLSRARKAAVTTAAVITAALVVAACGTDGADTSHAEHGSAPSASASPSASAPGAVEKGGHNAADVAFAQGMIPHHRQAVAMSVMARERASAPEVRELAAAIEKAQGPEIRTLSGWLTSWGEPVPAEDGAGHSGHDGHGEATASAGTTGGSGMAGMMTEQEMDDLEKSSGKAFDTAFLELMVKHHEGAVAMARTERQQGAHQPAKAMADDIIASQSAEITRMNGLLASGG